MIDGYVEVATGAYCSVYMDVKAQKVFDLAPPGDRRRALRIMNEFAENGPNDLNDQQFKFEARLSLGKAGGRKVAIYAVKADQIRVYGAEAMEKPRVFLCPEVAIKKTRKADAELLRRVARKIGEYDGDQ